MSKREIQEKYYRDIEDETLTSMRDATGIGGICNVEVCEAILNHVRECYCIFSEEEIEPVPSPIIPPPSEEKESSMDEF